MVRHQSFPGATMVYVMRILSTLVVLVLGAVLLHVASSPVGASVVEGEPVRAERREVERPETWVAPAWIPVQEDLDALAHGMDQRGPERGPVVRSRAAFVYDLDANRVLFERNADVVRPVASLTKMVSSLAVVRSAEGDASARLDRSFCITAAQYPTRNGATSRLSTGDCVQGWDVLGAALVASDNRGAFGLATVAGMDVDPFVEEMNRVSAELHMDRSSWSDPSGLEDENLSTARDMARATVAVASHPTLSMVSTAPSWDLHRANRDNARRLFSTNHFIDRSDLEFLAAKTGYTDTARYCFSTVLRTARGQRLAVTLLGAEGKQTRWADLERILNWVETTAG